MINQVLLVGRLVYDPELRELDDGKKVTTITMALTRDFKNSDSGTYDTDFIKCTLWRGIAEHAAQYCKKGMTVGIKARLNQRFFEYEEGESFTYPEVIAERITFINSPKSA